MDSLKPHAHTHTHKHTHIYTQTHTQDRDRTKTRGSQSLPEVNTKQFAMATILNPGPCDSPYGP